MSRSQDKLSRYLTQPQCKNQNNFVDVAKNMLIKLADKRKLIKKQTKQRKAWIKAQQNKIKKQNLQKTLTKLEKENKIIDLENFDQEQQSDDCIIVEVEQSQTPKTKQVDSISSQKQAEKQQRIRLFTLSLHNLVSIFLQQIQNPAYKCICPQNSQKQKSCACQLSTAVHRAITENQDISDQINRLKSLTQKQGYYFNEDRFIILHNNQELEESDLSKDIVAPIDHRGLSLLLKRINYHKYSLKIQQNSSNINPHPQRNKLNQKFFSLQYTISHTEYYKNLLQQQLKYGRYLGKTVTKSNPIIGAKQEYIGPSNFVRKLMAAVFQQKIKGEGYIFEQIIKLEEKINISLEAQKLLSRMRTKQIDNEMKEQQVKKDNKKTKIEEKIYIPSAPKGLKIISQKQKEAIEKALDDIRRNTKKVPYPYCLFLEYRLRARRQPHYQNPYNPSSGSEEDEDLQDEELYQLAKSRKIFKDMSVYKGYRGYKTASRIAYTRKTNKGILINTNLLSKPEQFQLKSLDPNKKNISSSSNPNIDANQAQPDLNPHIQQNNQQNVDIVPYPFCLSIFSANKKQQDNAKISQQHISQQHKNKSSPKFSKNHRRKSQTQKESKTNNQDIEVVQLID